MLICVAAGLWAGGKTDTGTSGAATATTTGGKFREAPMLAQLVASGKLPSVEQRLPAAPFVVQVAEVGKYGGTLNVLVTDNSPWGGEIPEAVEAMPKALWRQPDGSYKGDLAQRIDLAADNLSYTVHLNPGIRWSDGTPVSVDDYLFTYIDLRNHPNIEIWGANTKAVSKVDDQSFRVELATAQPKLLWNMAVYSGGPWEGVQPKHYLQKWHIAYNPDADKLAKEEGFDFWYQALRDHFWWAPVTDINKPGLGPFLITEQDSSHKLYQRNPYYPHVDQAANQLPYFDRILSQIVDQEVKNLKTVAGQVDINFMHTSFDNFTLYKENATANNQVVVELLGVNQNEMVFRPNQASDDEVKNQFFRMDKFRQALSVALNRDEMNKVVFLGKGIVLQATALRGRSWSNPAWETPYTQYDPALANRWLDEIGLSKKDNRGIRLLPDGRPFQIVLQYPPSGTPATSVSLMELAFEYWRAVGIDLLIKPSEASMFWEQERFMEMVVNVNETAADGLNTSTFVHKWAYPWADWLGADNQVKTGVRKLSDFTDSKLPGKEPPQWVKDFYYNLQLPLATLPGNDPKYVAAAKAMAELQAQKTLTIGTVGYVPYLMVANANLGNVPKAWPHDLNWWGDLNRIHEVLFWKK
jgi:peptide/nickel transport system substrate-binding protein